MEIIVIIYNDIIAAQVAIDNPPILVTAIAVTAFANPCFTGMMEFLEVHRRTMKDKYAEYEQACKTIREENAVLISEFSDWLEAKNLSTATIENHCDNIDFYVNEFLLYEDATPAADGPDEVGMFLGYWFIRKAMWASETSMKSNVASLKKFYQFMYERGRIELEALQDMKAQIKDGLPRWLETLRRYGDPSINDPEDVWGF